MDSSLSIREPEFQAALATRATQEPSAVGQMIEKARAEKDQEEVEVMRE